MDVLLLVGLPVLATILSLVFKLNFLTSTLLFFAVPSIYMSWRRPKLIKKSLLFAVLFATPMIYIFDHMAYLDFTWFVPNSAWRFLQNSIPIEGAIWAYLWVYFAVVFWEYFLDHDNNKHKIDHRIRYLKALGFRDLLNSFLKSRLIIIYLKLKSRRRPYCPV